MTEIMLDYLGDSSFTEDGQQMFLLKFQCVVSKGQFIKVIEKLMQNKVVAKL
jgi:hypothetical protein